MIMENTLEEKATLEAERLRTLLFDCGVEENRIELLSTLIDNTAWMKAKLDDAQRAIKDSSVCIPYDNGGGQKGIRENPLFKGYEALFKSYMAGMKVIMDALPAQAEATRREEVEKPKTMLELVRDKHKKEA